MFVDWLESPQLGSVQFKRVGLSVTILLAPVLEDGCGLRSRGGKNCSPARLFVPFGFQNK